MLPLRPRRRQECRCSPPPSAALRRAARLEQWRKDPLRKPCRLVQRALNVVPHLFEERLRRRRIGVCQLVRELRLTASATVLLHALVQVMFD